MKLNSWKEFILFIFKYSCAMNGCLYRGQRDPDWKLIPSIFRKINEVESSDFNRLYQYQIDQFKLHTRGRHTIPYNDPQDNDEKWWSLGQHYGLATPLLDWVQSPFVAAFFSFEKNIIPSNGSQERAIFVLDFNYIRNVENIGVGNQSTYIEKVEALMHDNTRLVSQHG